jgi:heterodisulfide reductase subunit B
MARRFGHPVDVPVAFVTQLVGLALGIDEKRLGLHRLLHWRLPERTAAAERERVAAEGGIHARA